MLLFTLLLGCSPSENSDSLVERDVLWAVPSDALLDTDGHVDLPVERLPHPIGGTAIPVERLSWRTGFSPVQTTVFFPTEWLDSDSLPVIEDAAEAGSVQIWDLDEGARIPCFAEVDIFPQDEEIPTLLVRPLVPMNPIQELHGHIRHSRFRHTEAIHTQNIGMVQLCECSIFPIESGCCESALREQFQRQALP